MSSQAGKEELEEQRSFLLDSIIDLELQFEAGDIAASDYDKLREDYTARAAEVLRAIEDYDKPPATPSAPAPVAATAAPAKPTAAAAPAPGMSRKGGRFATRAAARAKAKADLDTDDDDDDIDDAEYNDDEYDEDDEDETPPRRRPRAKKVVAWGLIIGVLVLVTASVFAFSGNKTASTPQPTTNAGRLVLAHQLESQGNVVDALKQYDAVLKTDPKNVEALSYRGWLLKLAGLIDQAQAAMDQAIGIDPTYPDVHFFKGMLLFQDRKDPAAAIPEFQAFLASNPPAETVTAVQGVLDQARQAAAASSPASSPTTGPTTTTK